MADDKTADKAPIFDFMLVRQPDTVAPKVLRRNYIHDDVLVANAAFSTYVDADLHSANSTSTIGKLIYKWVVCDSPESPEQYPSALADLLPTLVVSMVPVRAPVCVGGKPLPSNVKPLMLEDLDRHAYLIYGDYYYILPDRLEQISSAPLIPQLIRALGILDNELPKLDHTRLLKRLEDLFDGQPLHTVVFAGSQYSPAFVEARRTLFDTLYLLYILRRLTSINLEHIISGLQALHTLEALAIDRVYRRASAGPIDKAERTLLAMLTGVFPDLSGWNFKTAVPGFPRIKDEADLEAFLSATPIISPIFARLYWFARPFNKIRPLGVGDLKVVKQWLTAYRPGEISHIHNIMLGERTSRHHRRLERTEETFSFTRTQDEETTKDNQSTARFELKRECENVIKTSLSVNATLSVQYQQPPILVNVGGGFAYSRSSDETEKIAQNFSQEVVSKAISRVQTHTSEQRSITKLFETEENNEHTFSNVSGKDHVSGIYRWVDKEYTAQLFNYGKRLMYEFVLPEPAAFWVQSRLWAHENELDLPTKPDEPTYDSVKLDFGPENITKTKFQELRRKYDLGGEPYPLETKTATLLNREDGSAVFKESNLKADDSWHTKGYPVNVPESDGYDVTGVRLAGKLEFLGANEPNSADRNLFALSFNGSVFKNFDFSNTTFKIFWPMALETGTKIPLAGDDLTLALGFQEINNYSLSVSVQLTLGASALQAWQERVFDIVISAERKRVEAINQERKLAYDSRMADYRNRLAELKATAVNDLLRGGPEATNRDLIMAELKRQCLAMFTKEFDADDSDDLFSTWDSMGTRHVADMLSTQFEVKEDPELSARFKIKKRDVAYPAPDLWRSSYKGRYIQFLEQAFEWHQLAYIFYPYFWATPPKWVELMSRADDADPNLTAFLQAGAARVVVAVTPAYCHAVQHFLCTREPWEGQSGQSPVIGDPLYIPLHEELRKQQDDRYGAKPEGKPWTFTVPTSLVYLHDSGTPLPDLAAEAKSAKQT